MISCLDRNSSDVSTFFLLLLLLTTTTTIKERENYNVTIKMNHFVFCMIDNFKRNHSVFSMFDNFKKLKYYEDHFFFYKYEDHFWIEVNGNKQ